MPSTPPQLPKTFFRALKSLKIGLRFFSKVCTILVLCLFVLLDIILENIFFQFVFIFFAKFILINSLLIQFNREFFCFI